MKKIICVTFLILCLFFVTAQISLAEEDYGNNTPWVMFPREENVPLNKEWSVIFNRSFSEYETGTMVIEKNSVPIPVEIKLQPGNKKAIISPINEYLPDTEYLLKVILNNGNQYKKAFRTMDSKDEDVLFDVIKGSITTEKQEDIYTYTAPRTGRYRFILGSDNVQSNYRFYMYAPDNSVLASGTESKYSSGKTVDLKAGETYRIKIVQYSGKVNYEITIGIPNEQRKISGDSFAGSIRYTDQEDIYTYTAPRTGRYRFVLGSDNVQSNYRFYMYAPDNSVLASGTESKYSSGKTVDLKAGETYRIKIVQYSGNVNYEITIGIPNEQREISGDSFVGSIRYTDQEDIYTYTAPRTGRYRFILDSDNVQNNYRFYMYAPNNSVLANGIESKYSSGKTVDLEAGKTYRIKIVQYLGNVNYEITIGIPNEQREISGDSFAGSIRYTDQEDIYTYTAPKTGKYWFDFGTDNTQSNYRFYMYAPNNSILANGIESKYNSGKTVDLKAGEIYKIKIVQYSGKANYTITISIANN